METKMQHNIALIGFMGVGKTTVFEQMNARRGYRYTD